MMSKVKPDLSPAERKPLVEAGLIRLEKRGSASHIVLEDKAWDWAVENFDVELSVSKFAVPVLEQLLHKLNRYLNTHQVSLADVLSASEPADKPEKPTPKDTDGADPDDLVAKVRQAYFSIPDGEAGFRVRLHQLRKHLTRFSEQQANQALLSMQKQGEISLLAAEDLQEINADDESAAIDMGSGDKRYFVYMKR